jgi:hypothetical protein
LNQVRPLEPADIPQLVALRREAFKHSAHDADASLAAYYRTLFFDSPWTDERYPSLVYEGDGGKIQGFIGAIPRPMLLGDKRVTAVTSTELMVATEVRGLVGPKLLRRLFEGPQDLTFSDRATEQARNLYEALGGNTLPWYSGYWAAPLDSNRISMQVGSEGTGSNFPGRAIGRVGRALDRFANRSGGWKSHQPELKTREEPLAPETIVSLVRKLAGRNALVPDYDVRSIQWLFQRIEERSDKPRFITAQVSLDATVIGWLVYLIHPNRDAEVIQLAALPGRERQLFDHLLRHAADRSVAVVRGRLDGRLSAIVSERGLPVTIGQPWVVARSQRSDIATQLLTGNAFFSRLEAEWWIRT